MATDNTGIAWTDATWNPTRGCSRVSEGCRFCYAERQAARMAGLGGAYEGLVRSTSDGPRWTGTVRLVPEALDQPYRWKRPRRIFVDSMSDLFHESLANEQIAAVFGAMAQSEDHTFQVLTKRPKRAADWFLWLDFQARICNGGRGMTPAARCLVETHRVSESAYLRRIVDFTCSRPWPLQNVWMGVSVEDQATADERIPLLLRTPAAVRFVSYEPALGPVDFTPWHSQGPTVGISWLIVGGESGPHARPFDLAWARSVVAECKRAGVPCFYKQGGASNACEHDRKGGHFDCFSTDLKVREFPHAGGAR